MIYYLITFVCIFTFPTTSSALLQCARQGLLQEAFVLPTKSFSRSASYALPSAQLIIDYGIKQGHSRAYMENMVTNYAHTETTNGGCATLCIAIEKYRELPGASQLLENIFRAATALRLKRISGFSYELRCALALERCKNKIISFGQEMDNYKADIVTDDFVVECKNWNFSALKCDEQLRLYATQKLLRQLRYGAFSARHASKSFMLCSRNPLPPKLQKQIEGLSSNPSIAIIIG